MPDADVVFYPSFFSKSRSDACFRVLNDSIFWKQEKINFFGKPVDLPRLTAWHGDNDATYKYSGIAVKPRPWIQPLLRIKDCLESISGAHFNSVLLNLYRGERDSVSWHSDDEPELGQNPVIASVSFGETRRFQLRRKGKNLEREVLLTHGSCLIMRGATQHDWLHRIPKESKPCAPRINLTFRRVRPNRAHG